MSSKHKVLVVETARYRTLVRNVLERDSRLKTLHIEVIEATDGHDALVQFEQEKPTLIITELLVSKLSGFEVVRKIRDDLGGEDVPILVTTALVGETTTLSLLERRYRVIVQFKPFPPWALAQQVRAILNRTSDTNKVPKVSEAKAAVARRESKPKLRAPIKKVPSLIDITLPVEEKPVAPDATRTATGPIPMLHQETATVTDEPPSAPSPSKPKPRPRATPRRMRRGSLEANPLPVLLLDALEQKLSGVLTVNREQVKKVIYIDRGVPVFVQSNLRRETIGHALVRKGLITAVDNNLVLKQTREQKIPYGKAVVQLGLLDEEAFSAALQRNIAYKLECSLEWRDGSWLFVQDPDVGKRMPRCEVNLPKLVMEGLKEKSNAETALHRLAARQAEPIEVLPRFSRYRKAFVAAFGDRLVSLLEGGDETVTLGHVIQGMGSPFEAVLQIDILFKLSMARLVPAEGAASAEPVQTSSADLSQAARAADAAAESSHDDHRTGEEIKTEIKTGRGSSHRIPTPVGVPRPPGFDEPERGFRSSQFTGRRLVQSTYLALHHRTYYELLGLSPDCSEQAMEDAYEKVRAQFDVTNLGDEAEDLEGHLRAIHQALDMAYLVLADASSRSEYDRQLAAAEPNPE